VVSIQNSPTQFTIHKNSQLTATKPGKLLGRMNSRSLVRKWNSLGILHVLQF
jgi:hypothetical protein